MVKHIPKSRRSKPNSRMPAIMIGLLVLVSTITLLVAFPSSYSSNSTFHINIPHGDSATDNSVIDSVSNDLNDGVLDVAKRQTNFEVINTTEPEPANPIPLISPNSPLIPENPKQQYHIHFIHVPKCGGTSMTTVLRQMMCEVDSVKNRDCCLNPGFCDHQSNRRCSVVKGCINHFPNRPFIFRPMPTVTIFRDPVSRLVSAWFYRGHSPNLDFFQVRPEFKEIKNNQRPKVVFQEYLEMPEYNNILTRMLGADSFPYRNITITDEVFANAVEAVDKIFFIGLQEVYGLSLEVMFRELGVNLKLPIKKEREQVSKRTELSKKALTSNSTLMQRAREVNSYDYKLYEIGKQKFCTTIKKYPDLLQKLQRTSLKC